MRFCHPDGDGGCLVEVDFWGFWDVTFIDFLLCIYYIRNYV